VGKLLLDSITDPYIIICTILAFLIPFVVYRINFKLRDIGGAPWKKEGYDEDEDRNKKSE